MTSDDLLVRLAAAFQPLNLLEKKKRRIRRIKKQIKTELLS